MEVILVLDSGKSQVAENPEQEKGSAENGASGNPSTEWWCQSTATPEQLEKYAFP